VKPVIDNRRNSNDARAFGATLPPNIDISKGDAEKLKTGYPGSSMIIVHTRAMAANDLKLRFMSNGLSKLVKPSGSLSAWRNKCVVSIFTPFIS
jgi:hypothetical protein